MSYLTKMKLAVTAALVALSAWLGALAVPVYIMMGASVLDYLTGLAAAPAREEKLSSYKGIRGIVKEVCMWALVAVGVMVDLLLGHVARRGVEGDGCSGVDCGKRAVKHPGKCCGYRYPAAEKPCEISRAD